MRNSIENFAEQANMLENAHLKAIRGGKNTYIPTSVTEYLELYKNTKIPKSLGGR